MQGDSIVNENVFKQMLGEKGITLDEHQMGQFSTYYEMLTNWNEKINLTAITEKREVYLKHFFDSITPSFYYDFHSVRRLCDVGAGAGFPSLPLKICFPHLHVTIIDSLQKRITFLENIVAALQLDNVTLVHSRAEDAGQHANYRANYDVVTARAVANLAVLSEYCLPLCKKEGVFIALKGASVDNEVVQAERAINLLGGQFIEQQSFVLPLEASERSILWIKKVKNTPAKYPRKPGVPAKKPLNA